MTRLCFVIMPFSGTNSCTEDEWREIFENLFRPAVEEAGLGYECRRSEATRGNLISAIIRSLHDAHVVVADLTDKNPNVFYELGVRHAIKNRTILLAQDRQFMPSDLQSYANHVYEWKTKKGRQATTTRIRELLEDVDAAPDRPDNPVSDFLQDTRPAAQQGSEVGSEQHETLQEQTRAATEGDAPTTASPDGESLAGPGSEGIDPCRVGLEVGQQRDAVRLRSLLRATRRYFRDEWPYRMETLSAEHPPGNTRIEPNKMLPYALGYIERFEVEASKVECFALNLVEAGWEDGVRQVLSIVGDWLTISDEKRSAYKAIQGSPAVCALRLMMLVGAKAFDNGAFPLLAILLRHPLESKEMGGVLTQPLVAREMMLHPDALFGRADLASDYLMGSFNRSPHLAPLFLDGQDFLRSLAGFLFLWALGYEFLEEEDDWPLIPAYRLVERSGTVVQSLVDHMQAQPKFVEQVASVYGESPAHFREAWPARAEKLNSASLGRREDRSLEFPTLPTDLFSPAS